jgi:peptide/nickel transport system ATP-binding protein
MSTILEVNNLITEFRTERGPFQAVRDVSFRLEKGKTLGIVGESGSGKSVTSLSVMRLLPKATGRIAQGELLFDSPTKGKVDLAKLTDEEVRYFRGNEISMIFQEPMTSLNPVLTCGYQVMESLMLHKGMSKDAARARALELFEEVQLPRPAQILDSYPHQISGGQKQRVMIAMAMSCNPAILIADEPTTALDVTVQATILDLMRNLRDRHQMATMFISHDLGVIGEIADSVVVMYQGEIVEAGSVEEIFRNPQHPYTKGLLACRPRMDVRLRVLPTVADFMSAAEKGKDVVTETVSAEQYAQRQKQLAASTPILEVKNLRTWFPVRKGILGRVRDHVRAVDDVSFHVFPGETLGLVGESGCGKTTLGRTLLRLQEPTGGEIRFMGKDLLKLSDRDMREVRKDLQIIFQDPYSSLNPRMTIGAAIQEPMKVHGLHGNDTGRRKRVIELLERVNLTAEHYDRYPHEFSGGQRQRVVIARALAVEPKFIICDESVSALDVSVQAQVLNLLTELREQFGFTYIFISHDLSVVKFLSDRMMVMNQGKIEEIGIADEVYANPKTEYTRKLIAAIPRGL